MVADWKPGGKSSTNREPIVSCPPQSMHEGALASITQLEEANASLAAQLAAATGELRDARRSHADCVTAHERTAMALAALQALQQETTAALAREGAALAAARADAQAAHAEVAALYGELAAKAHAVDADARQRATEMEAALQVPFLLGCAVR